LKGESSNLTEETRAALIAAAPDILHDIQIIEVEKPAEIKKKPVVIRKLKTAAELLAKELPPLKIYVGSNEEVPFLVEGTCILSAKPKLGKSWFALCMCLAIAKGEDFLGYKTHRCSTLYLDLETGEGLQQRRINKALKGAEIPKNFYIDGTTNKLDDGLIEQLEAYMQEDPDIGVIVIDVFSKIRTESKNRQELEYDHAYRDLSPLNSFADKYHVSIVLVTHDRKSVDPDDPFANIIGSTGQLGATTQMIVMFRKSKKGLIHISVKGRTIDGLPELNVKFENAEWIVVDSDGEGGSEEQELIDQYMSSEIRQAVLAILDDPENKGQWRGRCSGLIDDACSHEIWLGGGPKEVGKFLWLHRPRFGSIDHVKITRINNGTGSKYYDIQKI